MNCVNKLVTVSINKYLIKLTILGLTSCHINCPVEVSANL